MQIGAQQVCPSSLSFPWSFITYSADDSLYLLRVQRASGNKKENTHKPLLSKYQARHQQGWNLLFYVTFWQFLFPVWSAPEKEGFFHLQLFSTGPLSPYRVGIDLESIWGIYSHIWNCMLRLSGRKMLFDRRFRCQNGFLQKSVVFLEICCLQGVVV